MFFSNGNDLINSLNTGQTLSGLDLGNKTIGVAISDKNLILPEYKMNLLNKNKKIIKKIENIENIESNFIKQDYKTNKFKKKYKFAPKKIRKAI